MKDVEIIGMLKSYIAKTLVGMGALKGAPCTVKSVEEDPGVHVITLEWTDNDGNKQTKDITVLDGTNGTNGFSPEVTVKTSTDSTYILTITTEGASFDTPNLKGGGSGGASSMEDLADVLLTDIANGQILKWDAVNEKWVNASLGTAAAKNATNAVTEGSSDLLESGAAFTALAGKANKSDTYTKSQTGNAITAEIEKLDVTDSATAGSYVTAVSEADGKISVTREAADAAPTSGSNKLVKSGGVFDANQSIYEVMGKNGAKNLLENTATSGTNGGITYTVNSDKSVTANGTSGTNGSSLTLKPYSAMEAGTYKLSCGVVTGSQKQRLSVGVKDEHGTATYYIANTLDDVEFTVPENATVIAFIVVEAGEVTNNLTFYPMIRLASDTDSTYQQYAKTNQQLTAEQGYITDDQWTAITGLYT